MLNQMFGGVIGGGPNNLKAMNPGMMQGMNPGMMQGMNPGMMQGMNPGMMKRMNSGMMPMMNPGIKMPMMNPGIKMPMMNPGMMMQMMNPGMMMQMMNPGMMPFKIKRQLTEDEKRKLRIQGYLEGKRLALERKKQLEAQKPKINIPQNNQPLKGNITVKFNKGGNITRITMDVEKMVAELLDEYFRKTGTQNGNFNFQGNALTINDASSLSEAGLKNGSVIIVS
jgi:hypothetical protein